MVELKTGASRTPRAGPKPSRDAPSASQLKPVDVGAVEGPASLSGAAAPVAEGRSVAALCVGEKGGLRIFRARSGWVTSALDPSSAAAGAVEDVEPPGPAQQLGPVEPGPHRRIPRHSFRGGQLQLGASRSGLRAREGQVGEGRRACATSSWAPDSQRTSSSGPWASPPTDTGASSTAAALRRRLSVRNGCRQLIDRNRNAQESRWNRRCVLACAFVLAGKQRFQFL